MAKFNPYKKKTRRPIFAKTEKEICSLRTDNYATKDFTIMICEDNIYLSEQRSGEQRKQKIIIKRTDFNKLIRWYQKPQVTIKRKN